MSMQKNVTKNELQMQVDLLNKITGNPLEMWKRNDKGEYLRDENGRMQFHLGTFILGYANGGVALERKGGSQTVIHRRSKSKLMESISHIIIGWGLGREDKQND
tara:strand:+ start:12596 stop:12907 length:312 start_codon:yes stop_codon:yes gene_type:complete